MELFLKLFIYNGTMQEYEKGSSSARLRSTYVTGLFFRVLKLAVIFALGYLLQELNVVSDDMNVWLIYGIWYAIQVLVESLFVFVVWKE